MTAIYGVLRPITEDDLKDAPRRFSEILSKMPSSGTVEIQGPGDGQWRSNGFAKWAVSRGLVRRQSAYDGVLQLGTVRAWHGRLRQTRTKNVPATGGGGSGGTRQLYLGYMHHFNRWLCGREHSVMYSAVENGEVAVKRQNRTFGNVEALLDFCHGSPHGSMIAQLILKQYLNEPVHESLSLSSIRGICAAVKSYFEANEMPLTVRVPKNWNEDNGPSDDPVMTLSDLYKIVQIGCRDLMQRALVLVQFQAGLDASTLADRFNFEAYGQIVEHFGTGDHEKWNPGMCPVSIRLTRVKTRTPHITCIDRDATNALRSYLTYKARKYGRHDPGKPIFVTRKGAPITPKYVSKKFSAAATRAGVQKKIAPYEMVAGSHKVRALNRSTLMACGCSERVADSIIGHKSADPYNKIRKLYPETIRNEYAKASQMINIISRMEAQLDGPDSLDSMRSAMAKQSDELAAVRGRLEKAARENEANERLNSSLSAKMDALSAVVAAVLSGGGGVSPEERRRLLLDLGK